MGNPSHGSGGGACGRAAYPTGLPWFRQKSCCLLQALARLETEATRELLSALHKPRALLPKRQAAMPEPRARVQHKAGFVEVSNLRSVEGYGGPDTP